MGTGCIQGLICTCVELYLEGQGDLVSMLMTGIIAIMIWLIGVIRVELLASSAYPEGAVLTYLAQWLGGTLHVVVDGLESEYDLLFGQGPIQAQLILTYITGPDGTRAPHYMLSGSWVPQVATRQRRARKRSRESSSSSASSTASM